MGREIHITDKAVPWHPSLCPDVRNLEHFTLRRVLCLAWSRWGLVGWWPALVRARPCSGFEGSGEVAFEGLKEARGLGDTWNRLESSALLPGGQVVREERAHLSVEPVSHQSGCTLPGSGPCLEARVWWAGGGSGTRLRPDPSWPLEEPPRNTCLARLRLPAYLRLLCWALRDSLCAENFINVLSSL